MIRSSAILGFAAVFALVRPAFADMGSVYGLEKGSRFEQGCFAPCMCPVLFQDDLRGRLVLIPFGSENGYDVFQVLDVRWMMLYMGTETWVQGSGTYRVNMSLKLQDLELDLAIGGQPVEHYDSGLVPVRVPPPNLEITISQHGMYCYDTVFTVNATPAPDGFRPPKLQFQQNDQPKDAVITWGRLKNLWTSD